MPMNRRAIMKQAVRDVYLDSNAFNQYFLLTLEKKLTCLPSRPRAKALDTSG